MGTNKGEQVANINGALAAAERGLRAKAAASLRKIHETTTADPFCLWESAEVFLLGKAYLVMYHFDVFDDEERNIVIAQQALMYMQRAEELHKRQPEASGIPLFEVLKCEAIIVKSCHDCLVDLVSIFYQPHQKKANADELAGAKMLADRVLTYVLYHILLEITDKFHGLGDDPFLEETCREIEETFPSISDKLMKEAANIRALMFLHLAALSKQRQE